MMRRLWVPALLASLVLAAPAGAASKPHITDPAGDVVTKEPGYDIRAVTFSTVKERGRPVALRIRMTLEQTPAQGVAHHYAVAGWIDDECRLEARANYNEAEYAGWRLFCSGNGPQYLNLPVEVKGRHLIWTFEFRRLPKAVRPGMVITDLTAWTGLQDIWFGSSLKAIDTAASTASYRIG